MTSDQRSGRDVRHGRATGGRLGLVAGLALLASLAAACSGSTATPPIVYVSPAPPSGAIDTATPEDTSTAVATDTSTPAPTPTPTPAPTVAPTPSPTPTVTDSVITATAPDARWTVKFHKPVVGGISPTLASAINAVIVAKMNSMIYDFNGHELPVPEGGDPPSTMVETFTVAYNSPTLLSIRLVADEDITGAAHPSRIFSSLNFRVQVGTAIALQDLFSNTAAALAVLSTQSRTMLTAMLGSDTLDMLNGGTTPVITNFNSAWVCTMAGLELTFQEYSVGPYSDGSPTIVIPWASLAANINHAGPAGIFFP